jgi:proteic killer suppression protein
VQVAFRTRKLRRQYERSADAVRAYGEQVGRRSILRNNVMKASRDIEELRRLPALRCHPLAGDRAGQWALCLSGFHRLIFTLESERLEIATIEEVSKHYAD